MKKNKERISIKEAKEVWEKIKDNAFTSIYYPNFESYWEECQRINNLPEEEIEEIKELVIARLKQIPRNKKIRSEEHRVGKECTG
jgi:DNA-directed RNA polymerase subunit F